MGALPNADASERKAAELAILQAAAECFAERGFAGTSIDMVARRMGYTKGRVYHYFRSKGELYIATASHGLEGLVQAVDVEMCLPGTVLERLARLSMAHVRAQLRALPFNRVLLQGFAVIEAAKLSAVENDMLERLRGRQRAYEAIFRAVLRDGIETGEFRHGNLTILTKTLLVSLNGCCLWSAMQEEHTPEDIELISEQLVGQAIFGVIKK